VIPDAISDHRPHAGRLDSWKEIAAYLRRGARTVQRWEREEGLPVRRLRHGKLGSVYAFEDDLDAWFARRGGRTGSSSPGDSIAVLPFTDLSQDHDQASFCDGVAEEITHALSRVDGLRTASRTASLPYRTTQVDCRHIGRRLGVGYLLQGSVRKSGDRLRIAVELVDAATGFQLWSERYERTLGDIFRIQDEIAAGVSQAWCERLAGRESAYRVA
jgi:TolB-like protein